MEGDVMRDRFFCRRNLVCFEACSVCEVCGDCDMCVAFGQLVAARCVQGIMSRGAWLIDAGCNAPCSGPLPGGIAHPPGPLFVCRTPC